jgi:hypothetical protein
MSEHTPGPWHVVPYGDGNALVICTEPDGNWRICFLATPGDSYGAWETIKADARLIAAAPEMFEALTKLLHYFGGPQGVSMQDLGRDAYVSLEMKVRIGDLIDANAALAKARPSPVQQTGGAK